MVSKKQSVWLWIFAVIFTIFIAYYQRKTGPTYPIKGKVELSGKEYKYKLLRTFDGDKAPVKLKIDNENIEGLVKYRIFRSGDNWTELKMNKEDNGIVAYLPHMPPAGKIEYQVYISNNNSSIKLADENVVLRYKGKVPLFILIPHIFFMFFAMLFSFRTGIEALFEGRRTYKYATITLITLFIGGLILGPIVQKYAFGDFWTGWPFGGDWTDNKTIFAFIFWVIAWFVLRKNKKNRLWPIIATIVLLSIYMIPHSMGGSELDTKTGKVTTGLKE
jgi:hypothetical protein